MKSINAMVITEDKSLLMEIRRILDSHHIEMNDSDIWEGPYSGEEHYLYTIVDETILETNDNIQVPYNTILIGLVRDRSFENARKWMKVGAKELIIVPDEVESLDDILRKPLPAFSRDQSGIDSDFLSFEGAGAVRAFYSAKGGTGKTLIAAMVAQNLQLQCDKRVILIDFNVQFGGVEVVFGLEPERSYMDLMPVIHELSINHIHNVAVKEENTGIHILLSPANPEYIDMSADELITRVIRTCRNHYDEVILDLPSTFNAITFNALSESTHIYYVLNPDSLSVRGLKHSLTHFRRYQIGNKNNVYVIVNRKNNKSELSEKNISQLIDLPIVGTVRADFYGVQPFVNMGKPFYHKKSDSGASKTTHDVRMMVRKSIVKGG
ncbi:MAG TPA: AAA family ATPase [Bacillaceae bacterium]|nr:AAA family ATPase [Paenibacillus bovis]HLU21216.1 AAA family ATPase [Bacillaceae bacterium]